MNAHVEHHVILITSSPARILTTITVKHRGRPPIKRGMRGWKTDAGKPEKQVIYFVWPKQVCRKNLESPSIVLLRCACWYWLSPNLKFANLFTRWIRPLYVYMRYCTKLQCHLSKIIPSRTCVKRLVRYQRKCVHNTRFFVLLLREFPPKTASSCRVSSKVDRDFDEALVQWSVLWRLRLLGCNMLEFGPLQSYCSVESLSSLVFSPFCTRVKRRGRACSCEFHWGFVWNRYDSTQHTKSRESFHSGNSIAQWWTPTWRS